MAVWRLFLLPWLVVFMSAAAGDNISMAAAQPASQPATKPAAGETAPTEQIPEIAEAVVQFRKRDFGGALALLQETVKQHPELPPARIIMAQLFSAAKQPVGVRLSLEEAVVEAPNDAEAYLLIGEAALRERRIAEAAAMLAKGAELAAAMPAEAKRKTPLVKRAAAGRAAVAEVRRDWTAAQKYLTEWLALDAENAVAKVRLGRALFLLGQPDKALAQLKAAAATSDRVLTPEATMAQLYEQQGEHEKAAASMAAALKAKSNHVPTLLAAARWCLETNQLDRAKQHADAAMQLDVKSLDGRLLRGLTALFAHDYPAAEQDFQAVALQSPNHFAATNNLALSLCEQDDAAQKRRALEFAQANVRKFPRNSEAMATFGWVLYKLGQLDQAERVLGNLIASGNISASTAYYYARVAVQRGRNAEAKRFLEGAVKTRGQFAKRKDAEALLRELNK